MDLIEKVVAKFRLAKLRIIRLWQSIPDCFWLLDRLLSAAACNGNPQNRWQSVIWNVHQVLGHLQMFLAFLGLTSALLWVGEVYAMFWSGVIFSTTVHCLAKFYLLRRYDAEICNLRSFLTFEDFSSGDSSFDDAARKQYRRESRVLIIAVGLVMLFNQLVVWIPNEQQREVFFIPPWIGAYFGQMVEFALRIIYSSTFILFWAPKLAGCTTLATVLLSGLKAEQVILNHKFELLTRCVKDLHDFEITRSQFWGQLRSSLKTITDQQVLILSHLGKLQPMVERVFFLTYYFALGAIGFTFYLVLSVPFSYTNCGIMASLAVFSLEIFQLGYQVESLRVTFEATAGHAFNLCAQLPFSDDHRQDYVELRTSLRIIEQCSRNVARFRCAGIAIISVSVYAELLHTSYSVLTFLLNTV